MSTEPSEAGVLLQASWQNYDGTSASKDYTFSIHGQRSDIAWGDIAKANPYSLEPVIAEHDLVGRREVLDRLIATVRAPSAGSSIIYGQKRVGKTSIAKALQSHLEGSDSIVIFLEGGDYVEPSARETVASLGETLSRKIVRLDSRISHIPIPRFDESIRPLVRMLDDVAEILQDCRLVIILDEFDELPADLYARGDLGNAFFLTLRSISSRPSVGMIIVGGEKMRNIMDSQGEQLNKWNTIQVDYFNRETNWTDYRELVQRPTSGNLEYTEDALVALHEVTAGNPFFTILICQHLFREAAKRRDCHITEMEVRDAIKSVVNEVGINTFQHFWEDGMLESGDQGKEKSIRRRRILIAISDALKMPAPVTKAIVADHKLVRDIPTLEGELDEFLTRQILTFDNRDESYNFKVPLLHEWLRARGVQDIITGFSDLDAPLRMRQQEEALRVRSSEIVTLAKKWGSYRGQAITEDKIRDWLEQFHTGQEQRLMFTVLSHLRFYSNSFVRGKMSEAHSIILRGVTKYLERGKLKRSDILVSYLDSAGKSGQHLARLYADEAEIYVDNIVEKASLAEAIQRDGIKVLIFLDDFVCTGNSVASYLQALDAQLGATIHERGIRVVFVAVVALKEGWQRIQSLESELQMGMKSHVCELLGDEAKCFGDQSDSFLDEDQRNDAKEVASRCGRQLEKNIPLGYGGYGLAIVFEQSCPNNSLPILWKESGDWRPLFKRN